MKEEVIIAFKNNDIVPYIENAVGVLGYVSKIINLNNAHNSNNFNANDAKLVITDDNEILQHALKNKTIHYLFVLPKGFKHSYLEALNVTYITYPLKDLITKINSIMN